MTAPAIRGTLLIILDDFREADVAFMPLLSARIASGCVDFRRHYADDGSCAPVRRGMFTAHATQVHRRDQDGLSYYQYCAEAKPNAGVTSGPWEYEVASAREVGDDPEFSSGGLANWLRDASVTTAMFGKYDHGYGEALSTGNRDYTATGPLGNTIAVERVPADWDVWSAHVGDNTDDGGGTNNLWRLRKAVKAASNVTNLGPSFTGGALPASLGGSLDNDCAPHGWCDEVIQYQYDRTITAGSASNGSGEWRATITVPGHTLVAGDLITVEASPSGYSSTAASASSTTGVAGTAGTEETVISVSGDDVVYRLRTQADPGTFTSGTCYSRKEYSTWVDTYDFLEWAGTLDYSDTWSAVLSYTAPHQAESDSVERERRFDGTVNSADFTSVIDQTLIDSGHASFNTAKTQWAQRMETLRSLDEAIEAVFDQLDTDDLLARTVVTIVSDQGVMYGERDFYTTSASGASAYFVKRLAFEPVRSALWVWHPHRAAAEVTYPTWNADVPLAILDWHGLTTHHAHTKREGYSLERVMTDHECPLRAVWVQHDTKDDPPVDALVTPDGYKWIADAGTDTYDVEYLFDLDTDPGEETNLAPSWSGSPSLATFAARAAALADAVGTDRRADWTTL